MKRTIHALAVAMALATFAGIASAQPTPRIDRREARQEHRIEQGVRKGQLTPREARRLRHGERHIKRMEMRAKANGVVTPRERGRITRAQNRESRRIFRARHNRRHTA